MAKTALGELIEWINEIDNSVFALSASPVELKMLSGFKTKVHSLLSQERKQIEDAFGEGRISFSHEIGGNEFEEEEIESFKSASDYYTKTYNNGKED